MRIALAYLSVILLWATTPLAIKWSGEGPGFLFAVTSRMSIGAVCVLLTSFLIGKPLVWHRKAKLTYLAIAIQIYGSMIAVYWSAQFIPSGWISVISGLAPLITALIASFFLKENELTFSKMGSYCSGMVGLYVMFGSALQFSETAAFGIGGVLIATFLQAMSAVWTKQINAGLPAFSQVAGGLLIALPCYLLTWSLADGQIPTVLSNQNMLAILYLGLIATTFGFFLYYYLLTKLSATRVALISLTTPVFALILGHFINREPINEQIIQGTGLILGALLLHEMADWFVFPGKKPPPKNKP